MESSEGKQRTPEERITELEMEMKLLNRQMANLAEKVLGTIPILALTQSTTKRLELAFTALESMPRKSLELIITKYIEEARLSNLSIDDMVEPIVNVFGLKRAWDLIAHDALRLHYGEWGITKWRELAGEEECEETGHGRN